MAIERVHQLPGALLRAVLSPTPVAGSAALDDACRGCDWDSLAEDLARHALTVLACERMRELGLLDALPHAVAKRWRAAAKHAELQGVLQRRAGREISQALTRADIRHAFVKGAVYRDWLYDPPWTRTGADLDILVERGRIEQTRAILASLDYVQASSTNDYRNFAPATSHQISATESQHYELAQFVRQYRLLNLPAGYFGDDFERRVPFTFEAIGDSMYFNCVVDVHWALHFKFAEERPLDGIIQPADGLPRLAMSWNLFTSLFKLYFEAFDRPRYGLHHVVDLQAMLRQQPSENDWRSLSALVERYALEAAAFYTLSAAQDIAGTRLVPARLLDAWCSVDRDAVSRSPLDYGDCMSYVLGRRVRAPLPNHTSEPGHA